MENKVLVVLGMHRSGTSLTAQWLKNCGLHMGDQLHGADIGNPEGHFEDVDFMHLHERILGFDNLPSDGIINHPVNLNDNFAAEMANLVQEKNRRHIQWGWKDPRTCLFLPYYRSILPNAKYLIVVRNYNDVVSSLAKRSLKILQAINLSNRRHSPIENFLYWKIWKLTKSRKNLFAILSKYGEDYLKVWMCYNEELLKHVRNVKKDDTVVCDLSLLQQQSKEIFLWLKEEWQFEINYCDFNSIYKSELVSIHINIVDFIKNKTLIEKADTLQFELSKYLTNYTDARQLIA